MNMMMQINPALRAAYSSEQELDGLVAGLGLIRHSKGRVCEHSHQRRLNRRRRHQRS